MIASINRHCVCVPLIGEDMKRPLTPLNQFVSHFLTIRSTLDLPVHRPFHLFLFSKEYNYTFEALTFLPESS
jgi:hypothetical protein